jgi:hypothetical protein
MAFELPGKDQLLGPERVGVQGRAVEQPRHGGQADMRMRSDLERRRLGHVVRRHEIDEAPRADGSASLRREDPKDPHLSDRGGPALAHLDRAHAEVGSHRHEPLDRSAHLVPPGTLRPS